MCPQQLPPQPCIPLTTRRKPCPHLLPKAKGAKAECAEHRSQLLYLFHVCVLPHLPPKAVFLLIQISKTGSMQANNTSLAVSPNS
jgi:hypothetical protein